MRICHIALLAAVLLLMSGCAGQQGSSGAGQQAPIVYAVDAAGKDVFPPQEPLVFEVGMESDSAAWLLASRERRSELNRFRYEGQQADEAELRSDTAMSKNWKVMVDGKSYRGYDVVKAQDGDFEDWQEPQKSDKAYGYTVRYGYS
ncbi:hypothetical protein J4435_04880 [Candidatus Woesearchaeota archaeon]|nr:hypothetical protein [Candidatus Woesearchaeota archaeon]